MLFNVTFHPSLDKLEIDENSTILEGAFALKKTIPYSCKDGNCGTCKCLLLDGVVDCSDEYSGLTSSEKEAGYILTCKAKPQSAIAIQLEYLKELEGVTQVTLPSKINSIEFPSEDIAILQLRLPPNTSFNYLAGQYIELIFNGDRRSYSIANIYKQSKSIEFHIRKVDQGLFSNLVFNQLKVDDLLRLHGPLGTFFVRESKKPIVFIAGGTGFAPIKAMVENLIAQQSNRQIYIYWGCQKVEHFYSDMPEQWLKSYENIHFIPVLSGCSKTWKGESGMVHEAVLRDIGEMNEYQVYASGSTLMINAAKEKFLAIGLPEAQFYSDAFTAFKNKVD